MKSRESCGPRGSNPVSLASPPGCLGDWGQDRSPGSTRAAFICSSLSAHPAPKPSRAHFHASPMRNWEVAMIWIYPSLRDRLLRAVTSNHRAADKGSWDADLPTQPGHNRKAGSQHSLEGARSVPCGEARLPRSSSDGDDGTGSGFQFLELPLLALLPSPSQRGQEYMPRSQGKGPHDSPRKRAYSGF